MTSKHISASAKISAYSILRFAARTEIFFYTLLWLIIILVAGTLTQKDIGLYLAQQIYFSSYIIWFVDVIPLPGGYSIMTIIFINLLAKLATERWSIQKTGTIILHVGALLLLLGGGLTAYFSYEGSMVIPEGESSNYISDYHEKELVISKISTDNTDKHNDENIFHQSSLKKDSHLESPALPFTITIQNFYRNINITRREAILDDANIHGMLKIFDLQPALARKEDEENVSGLLFNISGGGEDIDGKYAIFEDMGVPQYINIGDEKFLIKLRHKRTYLPFSIELIDFEKQSHPGTNKAKSYKSEIILHDGDLKWRGIIQMNEPLRYKGYTLYQSSFFYNREYEATVLAVVKNIGRMFPYISSIIMCIGLLVHLFQYIPRLIREKE